MMNCYQGTSELFFGFIINVSVFVDGNKRRYIYHFLKATAVLFFLQSDTEIITSYCITIHHSRLSHDHRL